MKKIFIILFTLLSWKSTMAQSPLTPEGGMIKFQSDSLFLRENDKASAKADLGALEASLQLYHNRLWTAEREEYLIKEKFRLFKYLPNIGIVPISQNKEVNLLPIISFNSSQLFNYLQAKQQQKAKLQSLDRQARLAFNEELVKLTLAYAKLEKEILWLNELETLAAIEKQQFAIYQEAFDKREMKVIDFLEKKKSYFEFLSQISLKRKNLDLLVLEIKQMAHFGLRDEVLYFEGNQDCIMLQK